MLGFQQRCLRLKRVTDEERSYHHQARIFQDQVYVDAEQQYRRALELVQERNFDKAVATLQTAVATFPQDFRFVSCTSFVLPTRSPLWLVCCRVRLTLCQTYRAARKYEEALEVLAACEELFQAPQVEPAEVVRQRTYIFNDLAVRHMQAKVRMMSRTAVFLFGHPSFTDVMHNTDRHMRRPSSFLLEPSTPRSSSCQGSKRKPSMGVCT